MEYGPSQQGSLLIAVGADLSTSIEEFAAIPTENFFSVVDTVWLHSQSFSPDDQRNPELIVQPNEIVKGRARSAQHVARIWIGAETSRAVKARRLEDSQTMTNV